MSILSVVLYPDDPLTKTAEPVTEFGADLEKLALDMFETMYAYDGVGLAAPQVGISKRLVVMHEPDGEPVCLVNPEILESEGSEEGDEGCLSLPELFANVPRSTWIRVRAQDLRGKDLEFEACDFFARVIQHETDHLNGIAFPNRLDILTQQSKLHEWEELRHRTAPASETV